MNTLLRILALFACSIAAVANAHTSAASSNPKDGSVLETTPPTIEITMKSAARMTSIVVKADGQPERKLDFEPKNSATVFKIAQPSLVTGRNEVHWTALSQDGHVAKGVIVLTIKPPGAKAQ